MTNTFQLLDHPYYQAWNCGHLSRDEIKEYTMQYAHHVNAFPRYVSAVHSLCENPTDRQVLLENLIEEDHGPDHHPELWTRFAEGMGATRSQIASCRASASTKNLVDTFIRLTRSSLEEGLGALLAYEQQVPEVASFKIKALKEHYQVSDDRTLAFFEVHKEADVHHTRALRSIIENLSPEAAARCKTAELEASKALWEFLDGMAAHA